MSSYIGIAFISKWTTKNIFYFIRLNDGSYNIGRITIVK